jgi:hypothetical protein
MQRVALGTFGFARLQDHERDLGRYASQNTCIDAVQASRQAPIELAADKSSMNDRTGQHDKSEASTTSLPGAEGDITGGMNAPSPRWFAKKLRQLCDRAVGRPCRFRETVRSETAIPSFSNSPWIPRSAPEVILLGQTPNQIATR